MQLAFMRSWPKLSFEMVREHSRAAFGRGSVAFVSAIFDQSDKFVLAGSLAPAQIGSYGAASRLSSYSLLPARAIALEAYPHLFSSAGSGRVAVTSVLRQSVRSGVIVTLPLAVGTLVSVVLAGDVLFPQFPDMTAVIAILSLMAVLRPVHYGMGDLLYALNAPDARMLALTASSVGFILTALLVAPVWGATGVAAALVGWEVVVVSLLTVSARSRLARLDG